MLEEQDEIKFYYSVLDWLGWRLEYMCLSRFGARMDMLVLGVLETYMAQLMNFIFILR